MEEEVVDVEDTVERISSNGPSLVSSHVVGMENPGSLCYLIAVVQQLFNIQSIRRDVLSLKDVVSSSLLSIENLPVSAERDKLLTHQMAVQRLFDLFEALSNSTSSDPKPISADMIKSFYEAMQLALHKEIDVHLARDASEWLGDLCKVLTTYFTATQQLSQPQPTEPQQAHPPPPPPTPPPMPVPVVKSLQGALQTTLQAVRLNAGQDYSQTSLVRSERFQYLSLEIDAGTLAKGYDLFAKTQFLPFKWPDPQTGLLSPTPLLSEKKTVVHVYPPVLAIHLNRFAYSREWKCKLKKHDKLHFPRQLQIRNNTWIENDNDNDDCSDNDIVNGISPVRYALVGVIVHLGLTAYDGHYVSLIRSVTTPSNGAQASSEFHWWRCNDHEVTPYDFDANYVADLVGDDETNDDDDDNDNCDIGTDNNPYLASAETSDDEDGNCSSAFLLFYEQIH
jgi:hypothetical protein